MRILLLIILAFSTLSIKAQTLGRQVLSSAGNQYSDNDIQVDYTLGEPFVTTLSSIELILTQGFQQADVTLVGISTPEGPKWEVHHYPNPTRTQLTVAVNGDVNGTFQIRVMDVQGRLMYQEEMIKDVANQQFMLHVEDWAAGSYFLSLYSDVNQIAALVFQKIN